MTIFVFILISGGLSVVAFIGFAVCLLRLIKKLDRRVRFLEEVVLMLLPQQIPD